MAKTIKAQPEAAEKTEETKIAVFLIEKPYNGHSNITEKSGTCLGTFNSSDEAKAFISKNHVPGNKYFVCSGSVIE